MLGPRSLMIKEKEARASASELATDNLAILLKVRRLRRF
jgi:hypothetical protein